MAEHHAGGGPDASLYERHRALIDEIVASTARHQRLAPDAALEFASYAWERLLAANTLGRFQGRCSLRTFLTVAVRNLYRDFRNQRWGKWRPSAEARRLGPLALRLEMLTVRDGYSFEEAVQILATTERAPVNREALERLRSRLPSRIRPRLVGEDELTDVPVPPSHAEAIERQEQTALAGRVRDALAAAMARLDPQDRLMLRLIFEDGFTVAQTAAALRLDQKPLYRRRDRLLTMLRQQLETAGVTAQQIAGFASDLGDEPEGVRLETRPETPVASIASGRGGA